MANSAVIRTGGKQYIVSPGQRIKVEKLPTEEGKDITFDEVLLTKQDDAVTVGTPTVKGAKVKGKVIEQGKHDKVVVFKYKPKKREKTKKGHRQSYSEIEITEIIK